LRNANSLGAAVGQLQRSPTGGCGSILLRSSGREDEHVAPRILTSQIDPESTIATSSRVEAPREISCGVAYRVFNRIGRDRFSAANAESSHAIRRGPSGQSFRTPAQYLEPEQMHRLSTALSETGQSARALNAQLASSFSVIKRAESQYVIHRVRFQNPCLTFGPPNSSERRRRRPRG
jgi:hypothetical protein